MAGHKYLTVVYQLDAGVRRLLWVGRERTEASFEGFFTMFGKRRAKALRFIASDMWKAYLNVIRRHAPQALHVLDRFHVVAKLGKAVDQVRATEARKWAKRGWEGLKHTKYCFLKRRENQTPTQRRRLKEALRYDLRTVRAYLLKEAFEAFWKYTSAHWAGWFLDRWCTRALRSRIGPMKQFAKTLRRHKPLLLNWFRARGEISSAAMEAMNGNAKLALRKARGFRTYAALQTALFHQLGRLPEPQFTLHRFW